MGKLQVHLDDFQSELLKDGYSTSGAKNYRFRASTFLKTHPEVLNTSKNEARKIVEDYIETLPRNTAVTIPAAAVRRWWVFRFGESYRLRITPSMCMGNEAVDAECDAFANYLSTYGNITEETAKNRVSAIRLFLYQSFSDDDFDRTKVTLDTIVDYHTAIASGKGASMRAIQGSDLRSYAKFLRNEGLDAGPLDTISLNGPTRRDHVVPGRLSEYDYEKLKASCDGKKERGARDLAMILCMGNLGLRACDVARIGLDDINWAEGTLSIHDSKSKTARTLPLDAETGLALEQYTCNRTSNPGVRTLFVNTAGNPITSSQVQTAVFLAAGRACIDSYHGTHGLRRMVATNMANAGVDAKTIADVLGHERIDTTVHYVKVSPNNLRKVANHWPEPKVVSHE